MYNETIIRMQVPRIMLYGLAGIVAIGAGIGARAFSDELAKSHDALGKALNPACAVSSECLALSCGGKLFVVGSRVSFDTVERIREVWCEGVPVEGRQGAAHCGYFGQCVAGSEESLPSVETTPPSLADVTELDVRSVAVYPNVASAIMTWELTAPAHSSVTITPEEGGEQITITSPAGESVRHNLRLEGLVPNTMYRYVIQANFRGRIAARAEGSFRVLPDPALSAGMLSR